MNTPDFTECPLCHGSGRRGEQTCDICNGSGQIPVRHDPRDLTPEYLATLHQLLNAYADALSQSELSDSSQATYFDMANNFVRWINRDFTPGSRSFNPRKAA